MMCRGLTLLLFIIFPLVVTADDGFAYESLSGVKIGRVFLSQSQRETLDARRHLNPQEADARDEQSADPATTSRKLPSAGFIIGRNGRSKVWKDGDFVDSGPGTRSMRFPGDISITRHVEASDSAADVDATVTNDSGRGDEDR